MNVKVSHDHLLRGECGPECNSPTENSIYYMFLNYTPVSPLPAQLRSINERYVVLVPI